MSQITPRHQNGGPRYVKLGWAMSSGTREAHCLSEDTIGDCQDPAVDPQDVSATGAVPKGAGEEARHQGLAASNAALGNRGG
jgi:hypothetical protein